MSLINHLFDGSDSTQIELHKSGPTTQIQARQAGALSEQRLIKLENRLGRLNLVVESLVRLVVNKNLAKPEELKTLLRQIDLEDGVQDGLMEKSDDEVPDRCTSCKAKIPSGKRNCVFCGESFEDEVDRILNIIEQDMEKGATFPQQCPSCEARAKPDRDYCTFCGEDFAVYC